MMGFNRASCGNLEGENEIKTICVTDCATDSRPHAPQNNKVASRFAPLLATLVRASRFCHTFSDITGAGVERCSNYYSTAGTIKNAKCIKIQTDVPRISQLRIKKKDTVSDRGCRSGDVDQVGCCEEYY